MRQIRYPRSIPKAPFPAINESIAGLRAKGRKAVPAIMVERESLNMWGVHRLAGAMLVQAIVDVRCSTGKRREEALEWINHPGKDRFSFESCCRMLNRDPGQIRRFLNRHQFPAWAPHGAENHRPARY